jgi:hypothetical protein
LEYAAGFSAEKFATTFEAVTNTVVPASHTLLFHYTTCFGANRALRSGIPAHADIDGVLVCLRQPHQLTKLDKELFTHHASFSYDIEHGVDGIGDNNHDADGAARAALLEQEEEEEEKKESLEISIYEKSARGEIIPSKIALHKTKSKKEKKKKTCAFEAVLAIALPYRLLRILDLSKVNRGVGGGSGGGGSSGGGAINEDDYSGIYVIPADLLSAMRPTQFTAVLEPKPWADGLLLLPPHCILRSYQLKTDDEIELIKLQCEERARVKIENLAKQRSLEDHPPNPSNQHRKRFHHLPMLVKQLHQLHHHRHHRKVKVHRESFASNTVKHRPVNQSRTDSVLQLDLPTIIDDSEDDHTGIEIMMKKPTTITTTTDNDNDNNGAASVVVLKPVAKSVAVASEEPLSLKKSTTATISSSSDVDVSYKPNKQVHKLKPIVIPKHTPTKATRNKLITGTRSSNASVSTIGTSDNASIVGVGGVDSDASAGSLTPSELDKLGGGGGGNDSREIRSSSESPLTDDEMMTSSNDLTLTPVVAVVAVNRKSGMGSFNSTAGSSVGASGGGNEDGDDNVEALTTKKQRHSFLHPLHHFLAKHHHDVEPKLIVVEKPSTLSEYISRFFTLSNSFTC